MKLSKYLADYIDYEEDLDLEKCGEIVHTMEGTIQQGIEAFESTEAVKVLIVSEEIADGIQQQIEESKEI